MNRSGNEKSVNEQMAEFKDKTITEGLKQYMPKSKLNMVTKNLRVLLVRVVSFIVWNGKLARKSRIRHQNMLAESDQQL